jgi:acyl-homoserine lactone acylase PvdQ
MLIHLIGLVLATHTSLTAQTAEASRWRNEAQRVTIFRDDWGIAHVYGKTDADAVFGMIYAQAEDDFNRIETNYLNAMGRMAEAEGESRIWQDLRQKLFIDSVDLNRQYASSPGWLKKLMVAWADGLNYYLAQHPEVKPRVITRFEPWMALSFTEGSIGGDIERIDVSGLAKFYGSGESAGSRTAAGAGLSRRSTVQAVRHLVSSQGLAHAGGLRAFTAAGFNRRINISPTQVGLRLSERPFMAGELCREDTALPFPPEPGGSNGFAIGPSNTASHHSLLLINPHTSFFFRSELQMVSEEDLDAYGAATWGQFFIYQGFNDRAGWMHTSSGVDAVDYYLETIHRDGGRLTYRYGNEERPVISRQITVPYKTDTGMAQKTVTAYFTSHGPVIREQDGKWLTVQLMNTPVKALEQSYLRTKARSYRQYRQIMELKANSSNNTIFADADGDIAYFHGNFIPRRDTRFDFTRPVDGSDPATDWHGLLSVDEVPHLLNPKSGFLFNVNNAPWAGAGESSLRKQDYPAYVETGGETARGLHAIRVLQGKRDFTLESLIMAAYDPYLTWFEKPIPALVAAWDRLLETSPIKPVLTEQVDLLRHWDLKWGVDSVATSLAIYWGQELNSRLSRAAHEAGLRVEEYAGTNASAQQLLEALAAASERLTADFGTWKTPWGEINRFQRLSGDVVQPFNDAQPSIPVGFPSANWGSLASFGARPYPGTKKWYGTSGNSFVAVVEFGPRVHARAVTAGGESGHPNSPHFNDEAGRYSTGALRDVYFYKDQLQGHTEREYHPGE